MKPQLFLTALATLLVFDQLLAQPYCPRIELGTPLAQRRSDVAGNNIATTVRNVGFLGRTGSGMTEGIPFEYPRGTGRMYIALAGMFVGAEVRDQTGSLIQIVSWPTYHSNPATGATWNFEAVPQYNNPASREIARSDDPSSWPVSWIDKLNDPSDPGWPGSWNGLLGKNRFINGIELYYHYSDNLYDRWFFIPDSLNPIRRGLGLVVSQRVLQWNIPILQDAVFIVSDIYNVGRRDIQRAGITWWVADFLGGDGDTQDDLARFDLLRRTIYFVDSDGISSNPAFSAAYVGSVAMAFLQTPIVGATQLGITNIQRDPAGSLRNSTPDSVFWRRYLTPGSYFDTASIGSGEYDVFASTSYFRITACSSQRFVNALFFSDEERRPGPANLNYLNQKIEYAKGFVNGGYNANAASVSILSPQPGQVISTVSNFSWNADNSNPSLKIDIYTSGDLGDTWRLIASRETNDGIFSFDPWSVPDGIFNLVRIVAYDSLHVGYSTMTGPFTINTSRSVAPQIRVIAPMTGARVQGTSNIQWIGGDADGDLTNVELHVREPGSSTWIPIATGLPSIGTFGWNTSTLPNAFGFELRVRISAADSSAERRVQNLRIANPRYGLGDTTSIQRNVIGTGLISVRFVNPALANGHTYRMNFVGSSNGATSYDVLDQTTGATVLTNIRSLDGSIESPLFDGMRILVRNDRLQVDTSRTHWNTNAIHPSTFEKYRYNFEEGQVEFGDYRIQIGNVGLDTSRALSAFGRTLTPRPVNFRVTNTIAGTRVPFGFLELDGNDGRFTVGLDMFNQPRPDIICLARQTDTLAPTWMIYMGYDTLRRNPQVGDTLNVKLFKPFQHGDTYRYNAIAGPLLSVKPSNSPSEFALHQNYPNPFNPQTNIRFAIPTTSRVEIELFDILGRRVRTLANEMMDAGNYAVTWNGTDDLGLSVASGVYFYRLRAGSFTQTRKLLLVR
jgi:hypothetical protein